MHQLCDSSACYHFWYYTYHKGQQQGVWYSWYSNSSYLSSVSYTHLDVYKRQAFWIQARVLKWANYPEIKTLDQYFDLIEKYNEANPTMADGTETVSYTHLDVYKRQA